MLINKTQSSNVPKFGNWESEENVPYTAYFEKARKVRTTGAKKMTSPTDPKEEEEEEEKTSDLHSQPKPEQEPVKTSFDPGETSGNRKPGKSVSLNNSYEKSPLHKNSYDGTGRSKPRSTHKGDESVRSHFGFYIL